jgi:hypothetical protein|tara:strand:- start:587 stop:793 length:207 start_codon:yes stop_codon:yes gene_type:complete
MARLGKVKSVTAYGIEAYLLEYVTKGQLPSTVVIGLPDAAVKECRDRASFVRGTVMLSAYKPDDLFVS